MTRQLIFTPKNIEAIEAQFLAEENKLYASIHQEPGFYKTITYLQFGLKPEEDPREVKATLETIFKKEGIEGTYTLKTIEEL